MLPEEIIIAPVVTEKSNDELQEGKYTFKVNKKATKVEGLIGKAFFERLMQDSRFDNIPLILETPDESKWKEEKSRISYR